MHEEHLENNERYPCAAHFTELSAGASSSNVGSSQWALHQSNTDCTSNTAASRPRRVGCS